jgi:hypothetical protein
MRFRRIGPADVIAVGPQRVVPFVLIPVLSAVLAACSGGSATSAPAAPSTTSSPSAAGSADASVSPSGSAAASVSASPSPTGLPGEPYDRGPKAGATLAVFGVEAGHTLALRERPGIDQQTAVALPSLTTGLVATGRARNLPGAIWYELRYGAQTGWSSARYLAWAADTSDVTAAVVAELKKYPNAETMLDLGRLVARTKVAAAGGGEVVVSGGPSVGDLGEITLDVATTGDDSVAGQRIHVFGTPIDEAFVLKSVESTVLCSRGVSAGRCV